MLGTVTITGYAHGYVVTIMLTSACLMICLFVLLACFYECVYEWTCVCISTRFLFHPSHQHHQCLCHQYMWWARQQHQQVIWRHRRRKWASVRDTPTVHVCRAKTPALPLLSSTNPPVRVHTDNHTKFGYQR